MCLRFFHGEAMAQWDNRALLTQGSRFESGWATIDLLLQCFPVLTETLCRHSSLFPRSRIKAFVRKPHGSSPQPSPPPPPPPPHDKCLSVLRIPFLK